MSVEKIELPNSDFAPKLAFIETGEGFDEFRYKGVIVSGGNVTHYIKVERPKPDRKPLNPLIASIIDPPDRPRFSHDGVNYKGTNIKMGYGRAARSPSMSEFLSAFIRNEQNRGDFFQQKREELGQHLQETSEQLLHQNLPRTEDAGRVSKITRTAKRLGKLVASLYPPAETSSIDDLCHLCISHQDFHSVGKELSLSDIQKIVRPVIEESQRWFDKGRVNIPEAVKQDILSGERVSDTEAIDNIIFNIPPTIRDALIDHNKSIQAHIAGTTEKEPPSPTSPKR